MPIYESLEQGASKISVYMNGPTNIILKFNDPSLDEPWLWGFTNRADFAAFVKMLLRADEQIVGGVHGN